MRDEGRVYYRSRKPLGYEAVRITVKDLGFSFMSHNDLLKDVKQKSYIIHESYSKP